MSDDPYEGFAPVYDRWQWLHTAPFSAAMIIRMRQAVREFGVPERSLLDVACGTGTLAWWWQDENPTWEVLGVDRSPAMIERARSGSAPAKNQRKSATTRSRKASGRTKSSRSPGFEVQDMTRMVLDRSFGMATCFFDSLNHVVRRSEITQVLARIRQSLLPDGLFLFDLIDEDSFAEIFSSPWIVQGEGLFVGTESELLTRRGSDYGRVRFTFFEDSGSNGWIRREAEILERCWRREEFDPLLEEAGLEIIHVQLIDPEEQAEVFVPRRLYVCRPSRPSRPSA